MGQHEDIIERLKQTGWRLTPQRLMIVKAIGEGAGHLGVDEIYRRVQDVYPYVDITTVYRTVHLLKRLGMVTEVGLGDRLHYELAHPTNRHNHMVCRACGSAFDLSPSYLAEFHDALVREFDFEPDLDNFTVSGVCARCRASEKTPVGARPRREGDSR